MNRLILGFVLVFVSAFVSGQTFVPNYDESKVPAYQLPDVLKCNDGTPVTTKKEWEKRRKELYTLFETNMYGKVPEGKVVAKVKLVSENPNALNGVAIRREVTINLSNRDGHSIDMKLLLYLPKNIRKAPVFLGYNFSGNHAITNEKDIQIATSWVRNDAGKGITNNLSNDAMRGTDGMWQIENIIKRGYGVATLYYGDVDPDFDDGFKNGVHALFSSARDGASWGSIATWAWGLSRVMDWLGTVKEVDKSRVIVFGHSRLGKTSLWAGASDKRFAMVISNESGSGGAALSMRKYGETITKTNSSFPHWFCGNFKQYNNREEFLPFDQHEILALIAPRPLYVCTAEEDRWGDPKGSFLACIAASPVYRLLGKEGIPVSEMPALEQPVMGTIGYHIRPGKHDVKAYDWNCFLDFADKYLGK